MIRKFTRIALFFIAFLGFTPLAFSQTTIKGIVMDASINDPIIGATLLVKGTTNGAATDWDGTFELRTDQPFPFTVQVAYLGYVTKDVVIENDKRITINLAEDVVTIEGVEVKASRISDKQKESPRSIETLDNIGIKETPASSFYDGLGSLKGVDLTAASLGFKVVNTRGFNSTSPVRSLQTIDGLDNQAPGLNFSLGNFLGTSELDINKVELIVGASSAFYGPNAFNGVISMETKDPFYTEGLSAFVQVGERNMLKSAIRWADVFQNKNDKNFIAYKLNFEYMQADDWVADNYIPVDDTDTGLDNPGRFDGVNTYGDEFQNANDFSDFPLNDPVGLLGQWHRTGYNEIDLVDYDTRNYKANATVHFRLNPEKDAESPELVIGSSFGSGNNSIPG